MRTTIAAGVLLSLACHAGPAVAQTWTELGGSATVPGGIAVAAQEGVRSCERGSIAADPITGYPVVAWDAGTPADPVHHLFVKQWDGVQWIGLGGSDMGMGIGTGTESIRSSVAIDRQGRITVAWIGTDAGSASMRHAYLKRWNGRAWEQLGGSGSRLGVSGVQAEVIQSVSVRVLKEAQDSSPALAWTVLARSGPNNGKLVTRFRRYDPGTGGWIGLDGSDSDDGLSGPYDSGMDPSRISLSVDPAGNPAVAWVHATGTATGQRFIYLRRWTGSAWAEIGSSATGTGIAPAGPDATAALPVHVSLDWSRTGTPWIAWTWHFRIDQWTVAADPYVRRWDGSAWTGVGGSDQGSGLNPMPHLVKSLDMVVGPDGTPVVTWCDNLRPNPSRIQVYVKILRNGTWNELDGSGSEYGISANESTPFDEVPMTRSSVVAFGPTGLYAGWMNGYFSNPNDVTKTTQLVFLKQWGPLNAVPGVGRPSQFRQDGVTPLLRGGYTDGETGFVVRVTLSDPDNNQESVEVEVSETGQPFTGVATATVPVSAGSLSADIPVSGLTLDTLVRWRVRVFDLFGAASPWISQGPDPSDPGSVDVKVAVNQAPSFLTLPVALGEDGEPVSLHRKVMGRVKVACRIDDTLGDLSCLEIEDRLLTEGFSGQATHASRFVAGGREAGLEFMPAIGSHHIRLRLLDEFGAATAWTGYGGNADGAPDFIANSAGSLGGSACAQAAGPGIAFPLLPGIAASFMAVPRRRRARSILDSAIREREGGGVAERKIPFPLPPHPPCLSASAPARGRA